MQLKNEFQVQSHKSPILKVQCTLSRKPDGSGSIYFGRAWGFAPTLFEHIRPGPCMVELVIEGKDDCAKLIITELV